MNDGKRTCNRESVLHIVKLLETQVIKDRARYSKHYKDGYLKALSEVERIVRANMVDAV